MGAEGKFDLALAASQEKPPPAAKMEASGGRARLRTPNASADRVKVRDWLPVTSS
jgi:hypothetical protein